MDELFYLFFIYPKNTLIENSPFNMILYTGTSSRCMGICDRDIIKCVPRSFELKPNFVSPITNEYTTRDSITWFPIT